MNYHDFKIASAYHYDKEALIAEMQQYEKDVTSKRQ